MLAMLFATHIIEGTWEYRNVPHLWVDDVKNILIAEGREDLIKR